MQDYKNHDSKTSRLEGLEVGRQHALGHKQSPRKTRAAARGEAVGEEPLQVVRVHGVRPGVGAQCPDRVRNVSVQPPLEAGQGMD